MAMMMEVEDDVFFADLNRQISLLITDDDDKDGDEANYYYSHPISSYPTSVSIQGISRTSMFPTTQIQYHIDHFDQMYYKTSSTTTDQSKGTGVFIPKSSSSSSSSSSQWNRSRRSNNSTRINSTNYNNYYNSYNNTNNFRHHQQQQQQSQTVVSQVTIGSKKW